MLTLPAITPVGTCIGALGLDPNPCGSGVTGLISGAGFAGIVGFTGIGFVTCDIIST